MEELEGAVRRFKNAIIERALGGEAVLTDDGPLALDVPRDRAGTFILGIWIEQTEGAKFWLKVFTDLKTRGCLDILIAVTDGLKGMSEALAAIFSMTTPRPS